MLNYLCVDLNCAPVDFLFCFSVCAKLFFFAPVFVCFNVFFVCVFVLNFVARCFLDALFSTLCLFAPLSL